MAELILERLNKVFGEQAVVRDLNLTIPEGAFTALLGPSGCGKTTTLRILAGLEHLSSGRLLLGDRLLADARVHMPPETRDMGMVFQSYALWPHMTVAENVGYPLKLRKVNGAARQKQVMEALDVVELGAYAGRSPQALSGGQRQRVALARCLVSEPEVVLLDEPLANLDRHLRATMEQTFREFHRRTGATFVYVTHDQAEAMALASHIAVMHQGELMQWGAPQTLYQHPQNAWVARFIGKGSILSLAARHPASQLESQQLHEGLAPDNTQPRQQVLVRPEHVMVGDNGLPAMVESCIFQGERYLLELRLPDGQHLSAFHSLPLREQQSTRVRLMQGWCLEAA
ncbi:Maltose/maltodextrin import ATP-binding protein MalK [Phytobacter ursingii]|uniref:ABC transporter ATP-binding protein n=2 Tax=Enterobacteriaceae TaxID=543 RepID=A0AB35RTM9_9ENTR|nr:MULTISPECIES: ABC transporter ATP-binding protein [Enterobacteriaceae]MDV2865333.1 ABC transporter ATP-binding protein [Phytobacter ursingii]ORJ49790.1 ABC transporter ATP-binding protein [Kluyvera intermedia]GJL35066.1 ABC transporter ATP-binding protein [Enterobacter hormaechei]VTP16203.1 Maltose/maltodextrin import ATP-binding protein MalK [Phytobacter ursingii]